MTKRPDFIDDWLVRQNAIEQAKQALGLEQRFRNYYECEECEEDWVDEWSCAVDDECPKCQRDISPYLSEDMDDDDA